MESAAPAVAGGPPEFYARLQGRRCPRPPDHHLGALGLYITTENKDFQPMGANMGIIPPLDHRVKGKREQYMASWPAGAGHSGWMKEEVSL